MSTGNWSSSSGATRSRGTTSPIRCRPASSTSGSTRGTRSGRRGSRRRSPGCSPNGPPAAPGATGPRRSEQRRVPLQQLLMAARALLGCELGGISALVAQPAQRLEDLRATLFAGTGVLVRAAHRPSVRAVVVGKQWRHVHPRVAKTSAGGAGSGMSLRSALHAALHAGVCSLAAGQSSASIGRHGALRDGAEPRQGAVRSGSSGT